MALLQTKIALIELLKRYTFTRAPETEVATVAVQACCKDYVDDIYLHLIAVFLQVPLQPGVGASLRPKNGIYLRVKERAI